MRLLKSLLKKLSLFPLFRVFHQNIILTKQLASTQKQSMLAVNVIEQLSCTILNSIHYTKLLPAVKTGDDTNVITSLTSYGERVVNVHFTIQSLLLQTAQIDKIVLWLAEDEFTLDDLPIELLALQQYGLEIDFCADIRSYKKLIPSLKKYPDDIIITFDDDVIYPNDHVERLLVTHQQYPNDIICHRAHRVTKDKQGRLKPYLQWQFDVCNDDSQHREDNDIFPVGIGGVLYPAKCFDAEVLNEKAFMLLAPHADDIWFKVMALKNTVSARIVDDPMPYQNYLLLPNSQEQSLWAENKTANDEQLATVLKAYPDVVF